MNDGCDADEDLPVDITQDAYNGIPGLKLYGSAASEALKLIYGNRAAAYGDRDQSFQRIADFWTQILPVTSPITKEQVALCFIAMKLSRELSSHQRDNLVDLIGYTQLLDDMRNRE
jgi:hypothetical protein